MIYLDNAATTQIDPEILKATCDVMSRNYGNPNAQYKLGREAHDIIEIARESVANLIRCQADNVVFTSGGAEGNSMVISGLRKRLRRSGKTRILVSAGEHDSVVRAMESMRDDGFEVLEVKLEPDGCVSMQDLDSKLDNHTGLVSIMCVNNETGAINPIEQIGQMCRERGAFFHTDCVQAIGTVDIDVDKIWCDFLTASGHKIHGLKGSGFLYARALDVLEPIVFGGAEQEFGQRGGTQNVPAIFALGLACKAVAQEGKAELLRITQMKQDFYTRLMSRLEEYELEHLIHVNGNSNLVPGKILNFRIDGIEQSLLQILLQKYIVFWI